MYAVEMKGITKRFGPVLASNGVDFYLKQGEIHALLGENGAGKTTLMRILYGLYSADTGEILVNGQEVTIESPKDAIQAGIGMVTGLVIYLTALRTLPPDENAGPLPVRMRARMSMSSLARRTASSMAA